jgi:hypothetical protein
VLATPDALLAFGNQLVGTTSGVLNILISNIGGAALTIHSVTLVGPNAADFKIVFNSCDIVPIAQYINCYIRVSFTPTALGPRAAQVQIVSNAQSHVSPDGYLYPASPRFRNLTGNGISTSTTPVVDVNATPLDADGFLTSPVHVTYTLRGCQGCEMYLVVQLPDGSWFHLHANRQLVPLPMNLLDITPYSNNGPLDGTYLTYEGPLTKGVWKAYHACDSVKDGRPNISVGADGTITFNLWALEVFEAEVR